VLLYTKGKNRRRFLRYDFRAPIVFTLPGDSGRPLEGIITNISMSGLCLSLQTPLAVGQEIHIESSYMPLAADKAIVRWSSKTKDHASPAYRAGLLLQDRGLQG
jgi:hypothetical protein